MKRAPEGCAPVAAHTCCVSRYGPWQLGSTAVRVRPTMVPPRHISTHNHMLLRRACRALSTGIERKVSRWRIRTPLWIKVANGV
jgi:hypothetical protein